MTTLKANAGKKAFSLLLAAVGTLCLCPSLELTSQQSYGTTLALFSIAVYLGTYRILQNPNRRKRSYSLIFGFAFGLSLLLGKRLDQVGTVGGAGILFLMIAACCFAPFFGNLFASSASFLLRPHHYPKIHLSNANFFALCIAVILLGWTPIFLAYYPGVFGYDVFNQMFQGDILPYNTHHPLVHTLLEAGLIRLGISNGNPNAGLALYCIVQMVLVAASIAYSLKTIRSLGCPRWAWLSTLLLTVLLPYHGILNISTTKDPLFSAAVLLVLTLLFQGLFRPEYWKQNRFFAKITLAVVLMCLLRNNAIYAAAAVTIIIALAFRKHYKHILCSCLAGIILFLCINTALTALFDAQKGRARELMCVPMQQMARVITLNPEWKELAEVTAQFQGEFEYNPALADPVKDIFRTEGAPPISSMLQLWLKLFRQYPAEYIDAFLELTRGWWDLNDLSHSTIYGEEIGYIQTYVQNAWGMERASLLPKLEQFLDNLVVKNTYQYVPVLSLLFSPAFWIWLLVLLMFVSLYAKRADVLLPALFPFCIVLTLLLGPCCLVRYVYPVMLCVPTLTGMLCISRKEA